MDIGTVNKQGNPVIKTGLSSAAPPLNSGKTEALPVHITPYGATDPSIITGFSPKSSEVYLIIKEISGAKLKQFWILDMAIPYVFIVTFFIHLSWNLRIYFLELQNLFELIVSGSLALDCCTLRWTTEWEVNFFSLTFRIWSCTRTTRETHIQRWPIFHLKNPY